MEMIKKPISIKEKEYPLRSVLSRKISMNYLYCIKLMLCMTVVTSNISQSGIRKEIHISVRKENSIALVLKSTVGRLFDDSCKTHTPCSVQELPKSIHKTHAH